MLGCSVITIRLPETLSAKHISSVMGLCLLLLLLQWLYHQSLLVARS